MATTNHIKTPGADATTIRGIGKLGYTESGKLNSTIKKIQASIDQSEDDIKPAPAKKDKMKCPGCGRNFRTNTGKLPKHLPQKWSMASTQDGYCTQKRGMGTRPTVVSKLDSTIINELEIKKGDKIAFIAMPWAYPGHETNELKEYTVLGIYLMDDDLHYIDIGIKNEDMSWLPLAKREPWYVCTRRFTKNFIKL